VRFVRLFASSLVLSACAGSGAPLPKELGGGDDLPLGDVEGDAKADGTGWGAALDCKPIPQVAPLVSPHITVSLDGLTLHLVDPATGYDRVFPIGPGRIDQTETDAEYGESLTYEPIIKYGTGDFSITPQSSVACKTWWTDPETGEQSPVFAGLPFMSWSGNYAIHGPIDNYRAANGGTLRRGFVSHGCVRMEAADVLEVYGRIHTVAKVPVHVQRETERLADGTKVDLAAKWIGSPCSADSECNFAGGFCATNQVTHTGFCSAHCTQYCSDRTGYPSTFCVADPNQAGSGMCMPKAVDQNFACRPYDHFAVARAQPRFNQPATTADVCLPRSPGWIGDHCTGAGQCDEFLECRGATATTPGVCTMSCTSVCPDQPGWADTFCAASGTASGSCVRQCTPSSNASECPADMDCAATARAGTSGATRNACVARSSTNH
jgi:hypothetical protein